MARVKVFGHRGAAGSYPENTMVSFEAAWRDGADGIELDVQMTRDNVLVVIHDETINRTTDGVGLVKQFTYQELLKLNAAHQFKKKMGFVPIPTLQEVYDWAIHNELVLNVELKNGVIDYYGLEERVINLTRTYGYEKRVILSSFHHESMRKCHHLAEDIETALISTRIMNNPVKYLNAFGAKALHTNYKHLKEKPVLELLESDLELRVYTVNTDDVISDMYALGVDSIITDYPKKAVVYGYTTKKTQ